MSPRDYEWSCNLLSLSKECEDEGLCPRRFTHCIYGTGVCDLLTLESSLWISLYSLHTSAVPIVGNLASESFNVNYKMLIIVFPIILIDFS